MQLKKRIIFIFFFWATLLSCFITLAQTQKDNNVEGKKEKVKTDSLNKRDKEKRKQGTWFYRHEARMGEPAYAEFGNYKDDKKNGTWYKVDKDGVIIAIENYSRNVLNGTAHYYQNGRLVCTGNYRGLNPDNKYDSVLVVDINTYEEKMVAVLSERGSVRHGIWRYYDPESGHMTREEEYQIDDLIDKKDFFFTSKSDSILLKQNHENRPHNKKKIEKTRTGKVKSYTY